MKIPLHLQPSNSDYCVPYTLKMLLEFHGIKKPIKEIIKKCKALHDGGTDYADYKTYLYELGFKYKRVKFDYDGVRKCLKSGHPVMFTYTFANPDYSHISLIVGAKKKRGIKYFVLNDSYYGAVEFPASILQVLWRLESSWARKVVKI